VDVAQIACQRSAIFQNKPTIPNASPLRSIATYRFKLRWTDHHPASHYGAGVVLCENNEVLDCVMFRYLRDRLGAWIDCDDPERIARALKLKWGDDQKEPGIGKQAGEPPEIDFKY